MADAEVKKVWPSGYQEAKTIDDFDYLMTGKNGQELTKFDKDAYKRYLSTTGQRMKSVPAGALPPGPSDKEMYMVLESSGTWTFGGNTFVNYEGQILTLWWNKVTYSVSSVAILPDSSAKAKPWEQKTYYSNEISIKDGIEFRVKTSVYSTTQTPSDNINSDWEVLSRLSLGLLTKDRLLRYPDGTTVTDSASISTDIIDVIVGDVFLLQQIRSVVVGSTLSIAGIIGYDAGGNFLKVPDNANDYNYMYVHTDANIKKIAFCCTKQLNTKDNQSGASVRRISVGNLQDVHYKNDVFRDNFFISTRANNGILAGQVLGKEKFPFPVKLKTKLTANEAATDANTFTLIPYKALSWFFNLSAICTVRLKSITSATVNTVNLIGNQYMPMKVGDTLNFYSNNPNGIGNITTNIFATAGEIVDFEFEILSFALGENREVACFQKPKRTVDLAYQALSIVNAFWKGERLTALGDSVTAGTTPNSSYVGLVASSLDMNLTNLGIPGATLKRILDDSQLALIPRDSVIVTISGGTNAGFVDGDIESRDRNNTYGQINYALDYIYANIPQAYVLLISPHRASTTFIDRNISINATRKAMKEISENRGVPFGDWWKESGWNEFNILKFCSDGYHPSFAAHGYMAGWLKSKLIMPLWSSPASLTSSLVKEAACNAIK